MTNTERGVWLGSDGSVRKVETNLYRYAANSPTNFTDPSGLKVKIEGKAADKDTIMANALVS